MMRVRSNIIDLISGTDHALLETLLLEQGRQWLGWSGMFWNALSSAALLMLLTLHGRRLAGMVEDRDI